MGSPFGRLEGGGYLAPGRGDDLKAHSLTCLAPGGSMTQRLVMLTTQLCGASPQYGGLRIALGSYDAKTDVSVEDIVLL